MCHGISSNDSKLFVRHEGTPRVCPCGAQTSKADRSSDSPRHSLPSVESDGSLPCSKEPIAEPAQPNPFSSHLRLRPPNIVFLSDLQTKYFYVFIICTTCATRPTHIEETSKPAAWRAACPRESAELSRVQRLLISGNVLTSSDFHCVHVSLDLAGDSDVPDFSCRKCRHRAEQSQV